MCCSIVKLCPTLCNLMNFSRRGFFVLHYLPEFAQIHVHLLKFISYHLILCRYEVLIISHVQLFTTSWTATHQASLSFTISQNLLKFMSFESVMPTNHLILHHFSPTLSFSQSFPTWWKAPLKDTLRQLNSHIPGLRISLLLDRKLHPGGYYSS